jgi:DNA-binding XRE family transcriptional regulator
MSSFHRTGAVWIPRFDAVHLPYNLPKERFHLAGWLLNSRQRERATQAQFAQNFGISVNTYRRWEKLGPADAQGALLACLMLRRLADRRRWRTWKRRQRSRNIAAAKARAEVDERTGS